MTATLAAVAAALGFSGASLLALFGGKAGRRGRSYSIAVAAGILLSVAFADLFPEGLGLAEVPATVGFVGGFAFPFLLEAFTRAHTHHSPGEPEEHAHEHAVGPFVAGLAVHNLADGFALGVGAGASAVASALFGLGVFVHQVPVGLSLAAVLAAARVGRGRIAVIAVSLGLAIPLAAVLTAALPVPGDATLGLLTGVAGGVLAYLGAAHLLPEARAEHPGGATTLLFAATLLATTAALLALPDG